jgi:hypothetical protein
MSDDTSAVDQQQVIGKEEVAPQTRFDKEKAKALAEYSQVEEDGQLSMKVKVHSPFRDYYDGQAFSVTAENATGQFDILAKHHNFISLLSPCELIVRGVHDGEKKILISGGIMHVKADQVIVFLDV